MPNNKGLQPNDLLSSKPENLIENLQDYESPSPEDYLLTSSKGEPPHISSLTAVAAEALETGVYPRKHMDEIPGKDSLYQGGDVNVDPLENVYSGDEIPGGDMPTPDQNQVDEIGQAYGITDIDNGELRSLAELLEKRDSHRSNEDE